MLLKLYLNNSSDNSINKNLINEKIFNIKIRNDFNITNPVFFLSSNDDLLVFNYCILSGVNRNYFINSIDVVRNGLYKINCSVDLLETYKSDILNSESEFMRKLEVNDYINVNLDLGVKVVRNKYVSDIIFEDTSETVMITIGD